jgi:antirestriction protein ArdC
MALLAFSQDANAMRDLYQEVTDRILAALAQGTVPWIKPW